MEYVLKMINLGEVAAPPSIPFEKIRHLRNLAGVRGGNGRFFKPK